MAAKDLNARMLAALSINSVTSSLGLRGADRTPMRSRARPVAPLPSPAQQKPTLGVWHIDDGLLVLLLLALPVAPTHKRLGIGLTWRYRHSDSGTRHAPEGCDAPVVLVSAFQALPCQCRGPATPNTRPEPLGPIKCAGSLHSISMGPSTTFLSVVAGTLRAYNQGADDTPDVILATHLRLGVDDLNCRQISTVLQNDLLKCERERPHAPHKIPVIRVGPGSQSEPHSLAPFPCPLGVYPSSQPTMIVSCYVGDMNGLHAQAATHLDGRNDRIANVRCHRLGLNTIGVAFAKYGYSAQVNVAMCPDREVLPDVDVSGGYLEQIWR
ncbi:hypothetical protein C8F01DRAFT_1076110 [Mycena amicta]|nr:hypothetical protein C8F01DRAFT_1076110 [Mycena amicta]